MSTMRVWALPIVALGATALALAGCATQPNSSFPTPPGFFTAIFHGFIAPFALILGIFMDVRIYAFPNSGWWYDLGFLIGLVLWSGAFAAKGRR